MPWKECHVDGSSDERQSSSKHPTKPGPVTIAGHPSDGWGPSRRSTAGCWTVYRAAERESRSPPARAATRPLPSNRTRMPRCVGTVR